MYSLHYFFFMVPRDRQRRTRIAIKVLIAIVMLFAQFVAVAHATDHLTHDPVVFCDLGTAFEKHDSDLDTNLGKRKLQIQFLGTLVSYPTPTWAPHRLPQKTCIRAPPSYS